MKLIVRTIVMRSDNLIHLGLLRTSLEIPHHVVISDDDDSFP